MARIDIHHTTKFAYRKLVQLATHRAMVRPCEGRDLRVLSSELRVSAGATIDWSEDVFGNAVALATFEGLTEDLVIESWAQVDLAAVSYPIFSIAASALTFPFRYSDDEWADLGGLSAQQHGSSEVLRAWAQGFVAATPTDTLSLLRDLNSGTCNAIAYEARKDEGTQTPSESLMRGRGTCRDIATLFIEAARSLGFGARAVSGYLYDPMQTLRGSADLGATHAWAEVYLPGAGWITFDPTNNALGSANLIPVAVGRDIRLVLPVTGSFAGDADASQSMFVEVSVTSV